MYVASIVLQLRLRPCGAFSHPAEACDPNERRVRHLRRPGDPEARRE